MRLYNVAKLRVIEIFHALKFYIMNIDYLIEGQDIKSRTRKFRYIASQLAYTYIFFQEAEEIKGLKF